MLIEKIIVVEDDQIIRRSLETQLRQRRCEVMAASNLEAAKEALLRLEGGGFNPSQSGNRGG